MATAPGMALEGPSPSPEEAAGRPAGRARKARKARKARRPGRLWFDLFVIAIGVVALGCAHAMSLGYMKLVNMDEAYAAAIAERLLEGYRLYEGAVSQRGPLMYYSFELLARLFGWDNVLAIRCAALGLVLALLGIAYAAARALLSRRAATIAFAVLAYAFAFGFEPYDGLALHGESLLAPMGLAGTAFGALAMRAHPFGARRRALYLGLAGLLFGAAACVKQTAAVLPAPLVLWWMLEARRAGAPMAARLREALAFVLPLALLPLVFVVHAWADGTLRDLVYYCFTYNLVVHAHPTRERFFALKFLSENFSRSPIFFLANAAAIGLALRPWWGRLVALKRTGARAALTRGFGVVDYLGLSYLVAFAAAAALPQMFQHYFIPVVPYLALTLAAHADRSLRRRSFAAVQAVFVACAVLWTFVAAQTAYLREKVDGSVLHGPALEKAARYVQSITSGDDKVFVWGFSPWLYLYAHRRPAGRFVFTTYPTGFVPWFWNEPETEPARVVPGSLETLLGDLDRERPAVVVDAGSVEMGRSMRAYAPASAWLHANYCFDARVGAFDVYRRKTAGAPCATDAFPYAAPTVDWKDAPFAIPSIMTVDFPEARALPPGDFLAPVRFSFAGEACKKRSEHPWLPVRPDPLTCNFGGVPLPEEIDRDDTSLACEAPRADPL